MRTNRFFAACALLSLWLLAPAPSRGADPATDGTAAAAAPASIDLPRQELEGIFIYAFGTADRGPGQIRCGVTVQNTTPYTLTSMKMALQLFTAAQDGGDRLAAELPFEVRSPGLEPDLNASQRFRSGTMPTGLPPAAEITGYYITLVSARGFRAAYAPGLSPRAKFIQACGRGDVETMRAIVANKAVPVLYVDTWAPTGVAAMGNHPAAVRWLLQQPDTHVRTTDRAGNAPLVYACYRGAPAIVRMLLDHGADPNIKTHSGQTLLQWEEERAALDGEVAAQEILTMLKQAAAHPVPKLAIANARVAIQKLMISLSGTRKYQEILKAALTMEQLQAGTADLYRVAAGAAMELNGYPLALHFYDLEERAGRADGPMNTFDREQRAEAMMGSGRVEEGRAVLQAIIDHPDPGQPGAVPAARAALLRQKHQQETFAEMTPKFPPPVSAADQQRADALVAPLPQWAPDDQAGTVREALNQALALDPRNLSAHLALARLDFQERKTDEMLTEGVAVIALDPRVGEGYQDAAIAAGNASRGRLGVELGRLILKNRAQIQGGDQGAQALEYAADAAWNGGEYAGAAALMEAAQAAYPQWLTPPRAITLGQCYARLHRGPEARKLWQGVAAMKGLDPTIQKQAADLLAQNP